MTEDPPPPRRRGTETTLEELLPMRVVLEKIRDAKAEVLAEARREFVRQLDSQSLERALLDARDAKHHSEQAAARSHRRWMILIVLHVVTGAAILLLAAMAWVQWAYAHENRARLELVEGRR